MKDAINIRKTTYLLLLFLYSTSYDTSRLERGVNHQEVRVNLKIITRQKGSPGLLSD
jgi:hypothetical protein